VHLLVKTVEARMKIPKNARHWRS